MKAPQPSDSSAAIAARLRLIRLAYGVLQKRAKPMSQAEFSRVCGIGSQAWNNAETGDNRLGVDAAMRVARQTGVSLDYIYFGNAAMLPVAMSVEIEKLQAKEQPKTRRA